MDVILIVIIVIEFILLIYNVIKRVELEKYILDTHDFIDKLIQENNTLKNINLKILDLKEEDNDIQGSI